MLIETQTPDQMTVAVVGAGIAGLTAAYHLASLGFHVDVFEASDRVGGALYTHHEGGWRAELGPNTVPDKGGALMELIDALELRPKLLKPSSSSPTRFIVRGGKLWPLPSDAQSFLSTPLLSQKSKLRLLAEPLIPRREEEEDFDESLYNLASRRFGEEVVEYFLDPFVAGTYAGSIRQLSSTYALKALGELEREYGSITRGGLSMMRRRSKAQSKAPYAPKSSTGGLINFEQGVETLSIALFEWLGAHDRVKVHLNRRVEKVIRRGENDWSVRYGRTNRKVQGVVLALPAYVLAGLEVEDKHTKTTPSTHFFDEIEHPPVAMISVGFRRSQITHPLNGFGMLIPTLEHRKILGAVFNTSIFPSVSPEGHVLLTTFIGGARQPELGLLDESKQLEIVLSELKELVGLAGGPVFLERKFWAKSIPQYNVGYESVMSHVDALEHQMPSMRLTGNWRQGISVSDTIAHAKKMAKALARHLYP